MTDATFLLKDASTSPGQNLSSSHTLKSIRSMIQKYDYKWTNRNVCLEARDSLAKERVVVTGTTGALGSYILAALLENDSVETVWALNRKSKEGLMDRQKTSFVDKMLDLSLLKSPKLVMLEGDIEHVGLGLREEVYHRVRIDIRAESKVN